MNEYIFFEFPEYQMAMFYFFNKEFESNINNQIIKLQEEIENIKKSLKFWVM